MHILKISNLAAIAADLFQSLQQRTKKPMQVTTDNLQDLTVTASRMDHL